MCEYNVAHEIALVQWFVRELGKDNGDGTFTCTFGELFVDERAEQTFESVVGSLKAAKKQSVVDFPGQLLLMPVHKDVEIKLLKPLPEGTEFPGAPKPTSR
jgi:Costars